jgi:hypothetical protein
MPLDNAVRADPPHTLGQRIDGATDSPGVNAAELGDLPDS